MEYQNNTDMNDPDSDGDTMYDGWETFHGLNATNYDDKELDKDNDGVLNFKEFNSTVLQQSDTDGWMFLDPLGNPSVYCDPSEADTDQDGLTDFEELNFTNPTDPTNYDTDEDEMDDGWEVKYFLDPRNPADAKYDNDTDSYDVDGNGEIAHDTEYYSNLKEYENRTNPLVADTDEDGIWDVWEAYYYLETKQDKDPDVQKLSMFFNPLDPSDAGADPDGEGLNNSLEFLNPIDYDGRLSTNPLRNDTDGDGVDDFIECYGNDFLKFYGIFTDPTDVDTDNDRMPDGWETNFTEGWIISGEVGRYLLNPTDPTDADIDIDNDGHDFIWVPVAYRVFTNYNEYEFWSQHPEYYCNPFDPDSLWEGMTDGFIAYIIDPWGGL